MKEKTKHTPTPWKIANTFTKQYVVSGDEKIGICSVWSDAGKEQGQQDAAHIVLCVNAHDSLVEELRRMVEYYAPNEHRVEALGKIRDARKALADAGVTEVPE